MNSLEVTAKDLLTFTNGKKYNTIYADPPWQFQNRTGKVAPEHKRLTRYKTMSLADIKALPIPAIADNKAHLYLWIPNALLRNVTELLLFGIKKNSAPNRTLSPARSQVNLIRSRKREHSRKPDEIIPIIEACSLPNRIELFARGSREGWDMWGDQAVPNYEPTWNTYKNHTVAKTE